MRNFRVRSSNRKSVLASGEESAWCVWRWGKDVKRVNVWGLSKKDRESVVIKMLRKRAEVRGPCVECGEAEEKEVEKLRAWWGRVVKGVLEEEDKTGEEV